MALLIVSEQAEIEKIITNALRDVSRTHSLRLKAGLRILMTTNLLTFESVCSTSVQKDLSAFKKLLINPESIAPQSTKTGGGRIATLNFIKSYTLNNLSLLDNRTAILPNIYTVKKSILEGERLKAVVHASALKNVITSTHYFDVLEEKFKEEGMPSEQIKVNVEKSIASTYALHKAAVEGNLSAILQSLSVHGVDVNFPDEQGMTPLHLATRGGLTETVKLLLSVSGIKFNLTSHNGWTPLHIAARMGYADIASALLSMSTIEPNLVNSEGWSALHWAAWHGFTKVVIALLAAPGILVNLADQNGTTPLYLAARNGHPDVIAVLLAMPYIEANFKDNEQRTPLHMAVIYNHENAAKMLLAFPQIEVNHADMNGLTPLHWAARNGNAEILKALLNHPTIITNVLDNNSMTPSDWAAQNKHLDILRLLGSSNPIRISTPFLSRFISVFKRKASIH